MNFYSKKFVREVKPFPSITDLAKENFGTVFLINLL